MGAPPSVSQHLTTLPVLAKHSAAHRLGQYFVTQRVGLLRRILSSMPVTAYQVRRTHNWAIVAFSGKGYGLPDYLSRDPWPLPVLQQDDVPLPEISTAYRVAALKNKWVHRTEYPSRQHAMTDIACYIEFR
jgi:hypothetical protein